MKEILNSESVIIVFDTNIYLNLYRYSPDIRSEYFNILKKEKIKNKLYLTETILFEIEENAKKVMLSTNNTLEAKIKEIKSENIEFELNKRLSSMENLKYPYISNLKEKLNLKCKEIQEIFKEYLEEHEELLKETEKELKKYDMVTDITENLKEKKRIIEGLGIKELYKITKDGDKRFKNKQAPGYKDQKNKQGLSKYNDLIIWKEIISFCKNNKKDLIYVTEDKKEWDIEENENKNLICVTEDKKEQDIEESENKKIFPKKMVDEFKKSTSRDIVGMTFDNFISEFCLLENISKPNGLNYIIKARKEADVTNILDKLKEEIEMKVVNNFEEYVDIETLFDYDGHCLELEEIDEIELEKSSVEVEGNNVDYKIILNIKLKAESKNYLGGNKRESFYSEEIIRLLEGKAYIYIQRKIENYMEIDDEISLEDIEIEIEPLREYERFYKNDTLKVDAYGDICPDCGKKVSYDEMAGDGFCLECSQKKD